MGTRALVLGSGGLTAIAWEVGVLRGLQASGTDVLGWDVVVGTSAGAFVGARLLAERSLEGLRTNVERAGRLEDIAQVLPAGLAIAVRLGRRRRLKWVPAIWLTACGLLAIVRLAARRGVRSLRVVGPALRVRGPGADASPTVLAGLGLVAVSAATRPQALWVAYWTDELGPRLDWPSPGYRAVAIAVSTGARVALDASSNATLAEAVAASTAIPILFPPVAIGREQYVDGGVGASQTNADLAGGCDEVLILAPVDRGALPDEVAALTAGGARVRVLRPSTAALDAIGEDLARLDPARCGAAEQAGFADASSLAASVGD